MAKIAICTPHREKAFTAYYQAIHEMERQWKRFKFELLGVEGMATAAARNFLVNKAREIHADMVWFIDDDVVIPPGAGILVDNTLKRHVVSGVYYNWRPPFLPEVYKSGDQENCYQSIIEYPKSGFQSVDAVGGGCICISIEIFEQLERSWYSRIGTALQEAKNKDDPTIKIIKILSPWFEALDKKSDDFYFCERLREIGIPIWVNWEIKCSHIGYRNVDEKNFLNVLEYLKKENKSTGWGA